MEILNEIIAFLQPYAQKHAFFTALILSIIYFCQKYLWWRDMGTLQTRGWKVGLIATPFALAFYLAEAKWVLIVCEITAGIFAIITILITLKSKKAERNYFYISSFIVILASLIVWLLSDSGIVEVLISVTAIIAVGFLSNKKYMYGWGTFVVCHSLCVYEFWGIWEFNIFQFASIIVALYGIGKHQKLIKGSNSLWIWSLLTYSKKSATLYYWLLHHIKYKNGENNRI